LEEKEKEIRLCKANPGNTHTFMPVDKGEMNIRCHYCGINYEEFNKKILEYFNSNENDFESRESETDGKISGR